LVKDTEVMVIGLGAYPGRQGPGLPRCWGLWSWCGDVAWCGDDGDWGYSIPASTKSKNKTSRSLSEYSELLFNVTSSSWLSSYTKPLTIAVSPSSQNMGSDYMAPSKRAGLGVGLALGFAVIIGAAIAWFCILAVSRRRREAREKNFVN
jgi:hypothetical protein